MTRARRVRAGATYLISRRVLRRHHLLSPDGRIDSVFLYVLAVYARKYRIQVHLPCLMSTHEHLVLTDVDGWLPDFLRDLHRLVALPVKVIRKWDGPLWDHEATSAVELLTPQAIIEELAYCMANPVEAGLVRYAEDWPGVSARPRDLGRRKWRVERPKVFFDPRNPQWPDHVELELTLPPMLLAEYGPEEIRRLVAEELDRQERKARTEAWQKGRRFLGADRCRKLSPYKRATTFEPPRGRNPVFAVGRGQRAAFSDAVQALRAFRNAYITARELWRKGQRNVLFPHGTWWMHRFHAARCADPPGVTV
ncbi:MAG: transposase [Myxococcota bacterium]